jgi:predicted DNA-binding transcriptional regulator YafY
VTTTPTSRLLVLLELLQDRPHASGRELADGLGVDGRTLRRYVAALQELGIPVQGQRGVGGGYRIRPGYRLPPLMLRDDEIVAVVLGLLAARASRLPASTDAVDGALTKIYRVLPPTLRRRVAALEATVLFSGAGDVEPVRGETLLLLAESIRRSRRLRARYTSHDQTVTERRLSPYGLVVHGGRWYLAAHDHGREALRTFRVDRIHGVRIEQQPPAAEPPPGFEPVAYVRRSLASVPWTHEVSVVLELPFAAAQARLPDVLGVLTPVPGGTRLQGRVESLDWIGRILAGLGCGFTIETPDELRAIVGTLAETIGESARRVPSATRPARSEARGRRGSRRGRRA